MSQKATGALTLTALELVKQQVDRMTNYVIDYNQIALSVDAVNSEFVLTARAVTGDGTENTYLGELRRPYVKLDLEHLLPGPLFIDMSYPLTYNQLRMYLLDTYQIVMEESELAKASTPYVPLLNGDYLDDPLENTLGITELVVTEKSGRFISGGRIQLIFAFTNNQRRLQDAYRQSKIPKISDLKFSSHSIAGISLFNASAGDCALEFFRRHHGVELDTSQIDVTVVPVDHFRGKVLLQPKYDSTSPWTGAVYLLYDKVDIAEICPDYLQINLPYPTTYQALCSFLLQSYGLQLDDGEVSAGSYDNPALSGQDPINVALVDYAFLDLYMQKTSYKWKGRSRLRVQFLQAPASTVGPRITSAAPDGQGGVVWNYQVVADGGLTPYSYQTFGTPPVTINPQNGLFNGTPTEGFYLWTTLVKDARGLIGVKTETAIITAAAPQTPDYGYVTSDNSKYFVSSHTGLPYFPNFQGYEGSGG